VNILIAAWHIKDFNVGLGRYARGLITALADLDGENSYEIVTPVEPPPFPSKPNFRYRTVRLPVFKRRVWEQVVPWLAGPHDIVHLPYDGCIAWKRGRLIVTIHDVKQLLFDVGRHAPSCFERLFMSDRRALVDYVITDSESSARDIHRLLGYERDRITVVYPGVDLERFRPAKGDQSSPRPYVLSVAGPDPTKNVETLIDAFARLPPSLREQYDLVLAGDFRRRPDLKQRLREAGLEAQVVFPGVVSDEQLVALYQQATVFVFPSRYEGFGLPVLEAMACGCPVISSNAASLPEVVGSAGLLRAPSDVDGFAADLAALLADPSRRGELRERGLSRAAQFSWERTARGVLAVYRKVRTVP